MISLLYRWGLVCVGLCRWSLLGVIVSRTAEYADRNTWKGIIKGRSQCDVGRHPLKCYQLIPCISYLIQWGKCQKCGGIIPPIWTAIECMTALMFVVIALMTPNRFVAIVLGLVRSCLLIIACVDIYNQTLHLPSRFFLLVLHIILFAIFPYPMMIGSALYILGVFVCIYRWAKYYAHHRYQMQEWFGQGDVMLAPILMTSMVRYWTYNGMIVTDTIARYAILYLILIASILGLVWYVLCIPWRSRQTLPFLPCMILAYVIIMIFQRLG